MKFFTRKQTTNTVTKPAIAITQDELDLKIDNAYNNGLEQGKRDGEYIGYRDGRKEGIAEGIKQHKAAVRRKVGHTLGWLLYCACVIAGAFLINAVIDHFVDQHDKIDQLEQQIDDLEQQSDTNDAILNQAINCLSAGGNWDQFTCETDDSDDEYRDYENGKYPPMTTVPPPPVTTTTMPYYGTLPCQENGYKCADLCPEPNEFCSDGVTTGDRPWDVIPPTTYAPPATIPGISG